MSEKMSMLEGFINMSAKGKIILISIIAAFVIFFYFITGGSGSGSDCGCNIPDISIPKYADSFEDIKSNWEFKECSMTESKELAEKIHVYVYYNSKLKKYRCQLLYSWPGEDCRLTSKNFGMSAITTGEISVSDFESGNWKSYDYWLSRQY
jgi:hypothetical protein